MAALSGFGTSLFLNGGGYDDNDSDHIRTIRPKKGKQLSRLGNGLVVR